LGHSGVGKTTYMASMYGTMQDAVNGFTLRAAEKADHEKLLDLAREVGRGHYPMATDQRAEYKFHLHHDGDRCFEFTWADYRGGALTERSGGADADALLKDLAASDGVLIFCDADAVVRGRAVTNQVGRMTNLVGQAVSRVSRPIPLAIIFTKADLVREQDSRLDQSVRGLKAAVEASQSVEGTIIHVACGKRPRNVALPVLFALHCGIEHRMQVLRDEVNKWESTARREQAQADTIEGTITDFFIWAKRELVGGHERTMSEEAQISRRIAANKQNELAPLTAPASALGTYLNGLARF
jgi:Double-GTPase 2